MPEQISDINVVETLRSKTEKADMKQYLKSTWGGYTKDSVQEYLNILRKQQQTMTETFSLNQQALFEEKERLKKSNDALETRLRQAENELKEISDTVRSKEEEAEERFASDTAELKNKISILEEELNKSICEKDQRKMQIEQLTNNVKDYSLKLEQSRQEKLSLKELYQAETLEAKKQYNAALKLMSIIEEKDKEIEFISSRETDDHHTELTEKIDDLTRQLEEKMEILAGCDHKLSSNAQRIEALAGENETLKQSVALLTKNLEEVHEQNERLALTNESFADQLESEYKRSLSLIKEKSYLTINKLAAVRKLEEANSKMTILEWKLQKQESARETDAVYQSILQTEMEKSDIPAES
ncbi:hypothetical protein SDC9_52062 [bioreactor metagenome]|uniref:Uncharacterized protein n=1 Tax=bioreactor metagenome TaxID=1076179 RepID=A0A644WQ45_9ZZZZ